MCPQVISIKDNDSLAAMLAAEVQADLLILMSDVDGMYTCPPSMEGARFISTYTPDLKANIQFGKKSRVGTGGMDSKVTLINKINSYLSSNYYIDLLFGDCFEVPYILFKNKISYISPNCRIFLLACKRHLVHH